MTKLAGPLALLLSLGAVAGLSQEPLAMIDGEPILEEDLLVSPQQRKLQQQIYELKALALKNAIASRLLSNAAKGRGLTVQEYVDVEVAPKIGEPTNQEVNEFYKEQKDRIGKPLKEVRDGIIRELRRAKAQTHLSDAIEALQQEADIEVFLDPPRLPVSLADTRIRGPEDAQVTIVEFSDFQCPFCRRVQPVLTELQEQYKDSVRWAFKDLPLTDIHPEAMRAAQMARCAGDQGKFWEYRAKLFEHELFTDATYTEVANELDLKAKPLLECADSGKHEQAVQAELLEGRNLGLDGTPAFLVNGILLTGARTIDFYQQVIDRELKLLEKANP